MFFKAKPMCKYGTKCFQKSRKHREMYCHEGGDKKTSEQAGKKQSDPVSHVKTDIQRSQKDPLYNIFSHRKTIFSLDLTIYIYWNKNHYWR
jgi:hypothetical protein